MTTTLNVFLSQEPAAAHWGNNALLSFTDSSVCIHLTNASPAVKVQSAARRLDATGVKSVALAGDAWTTELQWAFAQGYANAKSDSKVEFVDTPQTDIDELLARVSSAKWVREMINLPPQDIYPESLAHRAVEFIQNLAPNAVTHKTVKGTELIDAKWMGIHTVGRASQHQPVMLQLDYNPSGDPDAPVDAVLVGKGITFDSGGYSLKSNEGMATMKCDMGGAATVTGALGLAISRGLTKRVKLVLCCAENLIDGTAYKLGDIITYKNGTTVEILNTDAEGRLVLADGLLYAAEQNAPLVINAATLTGAAVVAVGTEYNALFGLDKPLQQQILANAAEENEPLWPLPLEPFHRDNCPSPYADTANSKAVKGGGYGGASNAAGFLSRFVGNEGKGWAHFDLAAVFQNSAGPIWAAGATGIGIRTIANTIAK